MSSSTALLTDHYELTMLQAALGSGTAHRRSVFELFPRRLPEGRRYGVVAGVGRALDALEAFRFDDETLAALHDVVDDRTREWLASYRFTGDLWGYPEGEVYLPYSPLLVVEGTFAEAVLLETLLLSIYNHDSAIASAASRMTTVAGERPCIEMGSRRTHEEAAVAAARAAYVAGFATSSNLAARQRYGVPTAGTSAHSFTLLHDSEADVFRAQVSSLGAGTTLLVDTYDIREAVRAGVEIAGPQLGAVRLDSGDLGVLAQEVRDQLDGLGATHTRIVVTSDLDEYAIAALASAPVDAYGVGTQLVTGSGHPTCGFVYKLVSREDDTGAMVSVAKRSTDKISIGGRKYALRRRSAAGVAEAEVVGIGEAPVDDGDDRSLMVPLVRDGEVIGRESLDQARARHLAARASCRRRPSRCRAASPSSRPSTCEDTMALLTCDFFSEALEVGTTISIVLPQRTEDQIGVDGRARRPATAALPAARAHRRPHRLAPLHLDRPLRRGGRPGGRDAVRAPQLLRRRGARPSLLDLRLRGAAGHGLDVLPRLRRPADTFVAGLSMGGYGALKLALTHPGPVRRGSFPVRALDLRCLIDRSPRAAALRPGVRGDDPTTTTCSPSCSGVRRSAPVSRVRHRGPVDAGHPALHRRGHRRRPRPHPRPASGCARVVALGRDDPRRHRLAPAPPDRWPGAQGEAARSRPGLPPRSR